MSLTSPVAIVVPMDDEFAPYRDLLGEVRPVDGCGPWEVYEARTRPGSPEAGAQTVVLIICDVGPVNAGAATERIITRCAPIAVLHGGSAGAHHPDLMPGDVVLGDRYVIHASRGVRAARAARGLPDSLLRFRRDGARISVPHVEADPVLLGRAVAVAERELAACGPWEGPGWPVALPRRRGQVVTGAIASADAWTVDPEELRTLHEDYGAECEDMESAYVAQVCALHRIPFLAVRAISDNEAACRLTPADVRPAIAAAGVRAARVIAALAAELGDGEGT
jgi:adenosylhomocysteine nucleosidase